MRFAIFSDIHSNLEALEAVLQDAHKHKCTHFVCLGDVVGYNANPHECTARVREMDCPIVKGNHDEQASLIESSRDFKWPSAPGVRGKPIAAKDKSAWRKEKEDWLIFLGHKSQPM